jgi:Tol biopolymer transport system component
MNVDGSAQTNITNNVSTIDSEPAWSPDGTEIAFSRCCVPGPTALNFEVFTTRPDGTGLTNLTNDPSIDGEPNWSPDGTKIAFSSNRSGNLDIYTMNKDGTGVRRLTDNPAHDFSPAWSPDGAKFAFARFMPGDPGDISEQIYVMSADGTQVTNISPFGRDPDWQALPSRAFKNAARFCNSEEERLGEATFKQAYGNFGGCVSQQNRPHAKGD